MSGKARGLGRGLSALLPELNAAGGVREVAVSAVRPSPLQPRREMDEEALAELVESVRRHGVLQPILVRPCAEGFEIVAGERRWRAAQRAGLATVPAVVRELGDERVREIALVENLQREDLSPLEEAEAYRQLMQELQLTQEEVAERVGKSRAHVANTLRLLGLPEEVRELLRRGELSAGHARALLGAPPARQVELARRVVREGLSVRETEAAVRAGERPRPRPREQEAVWQAWEERLVRAVGAPARIRPQGRGAKVEIVLRNVEELERLVRLLGGEE